MKMVALLTVALLVSSAANAQAVDPLPDRNSTRIDRLERIIDGLEMRVFQLEREKSGQVSAKPPADPLVGNWQCSNSIQNRNLTFLANGQVIIEEPTLGNVTKVTWTRLDAEKITISGSVQYEIRFNNAEEFELTETNRRSIATCRRQP